MKQPDTAITDVSDQDALQAPFELTALAITGSTLAIVTTNWTGRSVQLVPSASAFVTLKDWGRKEILRGIAAIDEFIRRNDIGALVYRTGNFNGHHNAGRISLRLGTAIELVFDPMLATTHAVSGWVGKEDWLLPLPCSSLPAPDKKAQKRALETAGYAIWKILKSRRSANG